MNTSSIFPARARRAPLVSALHAAVFCALTGLGGAAGANGLYDNTNWQFQTSQDRLNRTAVANAVETKRGGGFNTVAPTYQYSTYIYRQVNCSLSATATGNTGVNGTTASTSSPILNTSGSTASSTNANTASNGLPQSGVNGLLVASAGELTNASIASSQSNNGSLGSGVSASNTSAATGPVSAGSGVSNQTLTSTQSSAGTLASSINSSTACAGGTLN